MADKGWSGKIRRSDCPARRPQAHHPSRCRALYRSAAAEDLRRGALADRDQDADLVRRQGRHQDVCTDRDAQTTIPIGLELFGNFLLQALAIRGKTNGFEIPCSIVEQKPRMHITRRLASCVCKICLL